MGNQFKLLKDYENPSRKIHKGVIKTRSEWCEIFEHLNLKPSELFGKNDWFEKVEERIEVKIMYCYRKKHNSMPVGKLIGMFLEGVHPTEEQRILCEKAINGKLVDRNDLLHVLMGMYSEYKNPTDRKAKEVVRCIVGTLGVTTEEWFKLKKTTEVPISDCGSETVSFVSKEQRDHAINVLSSNTAK